DHRIDDIDHRVPYAEGGTTTLDDGDSYCRTSHRAKHLPGFTVHRDPHDAVLTWTTPTGHSYTSTRPPPLGHGPHRVTHRAPPGESIMERRLQRLIGAHQRGHLRQ
ncbi:MAG: hypothetical protein ACR2K2_09275, partial [Mycobacteriales bacterium]